jgi:hypothetical protein
MGWGHGSNGRAVVYQVLGFGFNPQYYKTKPAIRKKEKKIFKSIKKSI